MKILTKEEEKAHQDATFNGLVKGGVLGLALGGAAVYAAHLRFHTIRGLTLPMKAFLVTSTGTFAAIINADRASRSFDNERDPSRLYKDRTQRQQELELSNETSSQRAVGWLRENRYKLVGAGWVVSMGSAFALVSRNKYLTGQQKLVQARVYAQGLTVAMMLLGAMLEVGDASKGKGRWETKLIVDPNDPEHKHLIEKRIHHERYQGEDLWMDIVAAEERKMAARKAAKEQEQKKNANAH